MGLETPDEGTVAGNPDRKSAAISAVFQEDRLCESFSPMDNVMMCVGRSLKASRVRLEMGELLPEECLDRPVSTLSGGMKRRVAVLRALLTPSDILIMDEPFTGMDEGLKHSVIAYIREKRSVEKDRYHKEYLRYFSSNYKVVYTLFSFLGQNGILLLAKACFCLKFYLGKIYKE